MRFLAVDQEQVVTYLLAANADVTARDNALVMPLHCAAAGGSADCCKQLCARGANVNARDDKVCVTSNGCTC